MTEEKYYMIVGTEDGMTVSGALSKEEVEKIVLEEDYGPIEWRDSMISSFYSEDIDNIGFIIKGRVVKPKPVKTTTKYEVE